ncbi:MAG TPA: nucleoside 2-deoxyribosyltransferase [Chthonomonadales bacterium]|nr:nucleoside 2-deoxyribosyltransferase [Chthonomonadales bacterium]
MRSDYAGEAAIIYFAAPLFTQAEWHWNARLVRVLRDAGLNVFLPQESALPMLAGAVAFDPASLFRGNVDALRSAAAILAVLDQADPDSGVCWECGYACALGIPVIGIRTDFRGAGDDHDPSGRQSLNLMLARSCTEIVLLAAGERDDLPALAGRVLAAIASCFAPAASQPP